MQQENKKKQREIAEISKANACEPRVSIRKKDGTTELLIKPYPLMDYAKDPFIDGHWVMWVIVIVVGGTFVLSGELKLGGGFFAEFENLFDSGSEGWIYRNLMVLAVSFLIWAFYCLRYRIIYGTLGLRITDPDEKGTNTTYYFGPTPTDLLKQVAIKAKTPILQSNYTRSLHGEN